MVRVLQCFGTLNRGGIQSFVMNLYRKINREEIQFDFLLVNSKSKGDYYDEVTEMGGRCFYVCPRNENPVKNKIEIKNFFESHSEYKILHYHMSSCSYCEPIRYASKYGFEKIIMHAHSTKQTGSAYHTLLHKLHQKYCIKHATHYFACSDKAAKWLFRDNTDVQMINNGINSSEYVFDESVRSEVRNGLGIKSDEKVIGHVGRFAEPKNHKFLIEIFEEFHKRNENSKLVLVGDGDLLSNVQRQVQEKKLEKYVVFAGKRDDVNRLLQGFDLFLMPSFFEGFPVTLIEAQAAALPCVVSATITRQTKLLNEVEYISLEEPVGKWCDSIEKLLRIKKREDTSEIIIEAGYDSNVVAQMMSRVYLS